MNKQHPTLFTGDMVMAIREKRKTQTRRPVRFPAGTGADDVASLTRGWFWNAWDYKTYTHHWQCGDEFIHPNYQVGDDLYVREAFQFVETQYDGYCICYRADGEIRKILYNEEDDWGNPKGCYGIGNPVKDFFEGPWRPSIHMPRWAARLVMSITEVRIQRLGEITEEDAAAEGVIAGEQCCNSYRCAFLKLWNKMYKSPVGIDDNPWVIAATFQPLEVF